MTGSGLPACSLDDTQAEIIARLDRIEGKVDHTNGRVRDLETRMEIADRDRAGLSAQVEAIRAHAVDEIKHALRTVVGEELDRRQTEADAAAFRAIKKELGDPVAKLKQINRLERFVTSTLSKIWILVVTAVTLAIIAMVAERLF